MKKIILALATLVVMPIFMSHDVVKADGSYDYMYNCPPQNTQQCWATYKANSTSGWKTIESNFQSLLAACNRRDINACFAHVAPEIQMRDSAGQVHDMKRYRQSALDFWQRTPQSRQSAYIVSQDVGKDYAKVTGLSYLDYLDRNSINVPMRMEANFEHTWKRTSNGWKLVNVVFSNQQVYAKGQVPGGPAISPGAGFSGGNIGGGAANMIREAGNGLGTVR